MLLAERSVFSTNIFSHQVVVKKNVRRFGTALANKKDLTEISSTKQETIFPLKVSNPILAQSVVAVLGLGFIDAGYSGDWSRIGVISRETEDLLKVAAILVVPLCLFLVYSLSKKQED